MYTILLCALDCDSFSALKWNLPQSVALSVTIPQSFVKRKSHFYGNFWSFKLHPGKPYHLDYSGLNRDDVSRKSPQLLGHYLKFKNKVCTSLALPKFFSKHGSRCQRCACSTKMSQNLLMGQKSSTWVVIEIKAISPWFVAIWVSDARSIERFGVFGDLKNLTVQ